MRRLVGASMATALALALGAGGAVAGPPYAAPGPPTHEGSIGAHALLDGDEYGGVFCQYSAAGSLNKLRIRRPLVFARDRTSGVDSQVVGWRYVLDGWKDFQWQVVDKGPLRKLSATDVRIADFQPVVHVLGSLDHEVYRVRHRLFWYRPGHPTQLQGSSEHPVTRYENIGGVWNGSDVYFCGPALSMPPPTTPPAGHPGAYGVHRLLDTGEYPGMICRYDQALPHDLLSLRARPAIAFADAGEGEQRIRRSVLLQYTDEDVTDPTWTTLRTIGPVARDAGPSDAVVFPAVTVSLGDDGPDHERWRLVQRLRWPSGRADEVAVYSRQIDTSPSTEHASSCAGVD